MTPALLFPNEDRTFGGNALYVDLIPRSCWFTNVRSCVRAEDWDTIRRVVYGRCGHRCEVCGVTGRVAAHERWAYDETRAVQILRRLICLCGDCHLATHMGLAQLRGLGDVAAVHLQRVNTWTAEQTENHIVWAFALWRSRNAIDWTLDLSMLTDAGIRPVVPPRLRRRQIAHEVLSRVRDHGHGHGQ